MKYLVVLLVVFSIGCTGTVKYPITVKAVDQVTDGRCAIQFKMEENPPAWTEYSTELCHYKVGDVLR